VAVAGTRADVSGQRQWDALRAAWDAIGLALFVVDRSAELLIANQSARRMLERAGVICLRANTLCAATDAETQNLKAAIDAATDKARVAASLILTADGSRPQFFTIVPLALAAGNAALLMARDPDLVDTTLPHRVRSLFHLTAAETKLAIALSEGVSVLQYAREHAITQSTVRSQTKSIAAKMHCSRQVEIAAVVASLLVIQTDG
jgi:DNA-binding CsgD family transcriptional regulator